MDQPLKFGFIPIEGGAYYPEFLEEVLLGEQLGFDSVWLEEHHGIRDHYWPSPLIGLAGIARWEHLIPPQMEQPEYNMFNRERVEKEYARLYRDFGLGTTIYSPLASGLLTGKYNEGIPRGTRASLPDYQWLRQDFEREEAQRNIEKVKRIQPIAKEIGCTMAQLALAWCLKNPYVSTVIIGASRSEQVHESMKALEIVARSTDPVIEQIEAILENKPHRESDFREE